MKGKIDIQSLADERNITIDKVGVKNVQYPIIVEDRANKIQNTVANLDMFVELPHNHRGTHMSRFLEVLNHFHQENFIRNQSGSNLKLFFFGIPSGNNIFFILILTTRFSLSKYLSEGEMPHIYLAKR